MVLYVTRASETGGVFRFTLGAFSHVQRKPMLADSEVVKWMSQWRRQPAVLPVNTGEISHSSSRTVFPSNLAAQRCFSCMLLSGLFPQVVEHQASCFRNMFTSSLCLHFGGLLRFYLVGKITDFYHVERACHLGLFGWLFYIKGCGGFGGESSQHPTMQVALWLTLQRDWASTAQQSSQCFGPNYWHQRDGLQLPWFSPRWLKLLHGKFYLSPKLCIDLLAISRKVCFKQQGACWRGKSNLFFFF